MLTRGIWEWEYILAQSHINVNIRLCVRSGSDLVLSRLIVSLFITNNRLCYYKLFCLFPVYFPVVVCFPNKIVSIYKYINRFVINMNKMSGIVSFRRNILGWLGERTTAHSLLVRALYRCAHQAVEREDRQSLIFQYRSNSLKTNLTPE